MPRSSFRKNCFVPLTSKIKTYDFVGFDVETVQGKFYSGGLWWIVEGQEKWFYTTDKRELINKILSREFMNYRVVATNLGYDFNSLFFDEPEWNEFNSVIMRNSRIMFADWRPVSKRRVHKNKNDASHGRILFYDTLNYAGMSVEKMGEVIGMNKMKAPDFLGEREPVQYGDDDNKHTYEQESINGEIKYYTEAQYLEQYNKRDCMISAKFMYFFQEAINSLGGKLQMTSASTAMDVYRRKYMKDMIIKESYITKDDDFNDFIFEGYYGGRTEVFSRGLVHGANYYDVNSLYPFCMKKDFPLPQSVKVIKQLDVGLIHRYMGVTECTIKAPKMKYPILPVKKDKLLFPVGKFRGTWNNNELAYAIDNGYKVISVHRQVIYQESHRPFENFVDDLYDKRLQYKREGNPFELITKLMMNSLYGKFAQKHVSEYRVFDDDPKTVPYEFEIETYKKKSSWKIETIDNKLIFRKDKKCNSIFIFPIYSSYVTSYARIHMHRLIKETNALYTDTDSIITFETVKSGGLLGELKAEGLNESGIIVKPKMYLYADDVKIKGISKTVDKNGKIIKTTKKDLMELIYGRGVTKKRFTGLKESIRRGMKPNTEILVEKKLSVEDNKREWNELFNPDELQHSEPLTVNIS